MNALGAASTCIGCILLLALPRRHASLAILLGASYMTRGQILEMGGAHFTVIQMMVGAGFVRVLLRREQLAIGWYAVDRLMVAWAVCLLAMSAFHGGDQLMFRAGMVWTQLGCYFLLRIFLQDLDDVRRMFRVSCVMLAPLAVLMLVEKTTGGNPFAPLGGVNEIAAVRQGHVRANGPFAHAILAGTVGATLLMFAAALWHRRRGSAVLGMLAGGTIVFASTSSGPILMAALGFVSLWIFTVRRWLSTIRWLALSALAALQIVMNDPVYFIMARIDLSGGSTGWHRAQLIRSSIAHLDEWWATGTDYTRHWMPTGIYASPDHTDITNHFLMMGVLGGLPLLALFVMTLLAAFSRVGSAVRASAHEPDDVHLAWALGALLFAHAVNLVSITLFDQSVVFFLLVLAAVGAVPCAALTHRRNVRATVRVPGPEAPA